MSFNIDDMDNNILHAIAVAKEKHNVKADFSFINGLPTNEEEYNNNIRWLNGEDEDGNQLYHADQKITWSQVQAVVSEASARNKLHKLRKERNRLLAETDWMANSDVTMSIAWRNYRQALRDITTQTPTDDALSNIIFPTKPSE
tara:strand:- start:132 stop:563 length:432 start_codon:yes stop_codon:yes gene_type:complete